MDVWEIIGYIIAAVLIFILLVFIYGAMLIQKGWVDEDEEGSGKGNQSVDLFEVPIDKTNEERNKGTSRRERNDKWL